jgi:hypothetical protein
MFSWVEYVQNRAATSPLRYRLNPFVRLSRRRMETERHLWNTAYHWGDWLIPSLTDSSVLGMLRSALATKRVVASAYFARSTALAAEAAGSLGREEADRYIGREGRIRPDPRASTSSPSASASCPRRCANAPSAAWSSSSRLTAAGSTRASSPCPSSSTSSSRVEGGLALEAFSGDYEFEYELMARK